MKKVLLIYNPASGNGLFKNNLDDVVANLQNGSDFTMVSTVRITQGIDLASSEMIEQYKQFDLIIGAGGDGTISIICDILIQNNLDIPVAIIPAGTANDFAMHLGTPKAPGAAALSIIKGKALPCDLGKVLDKHFINVVACGSFANTSDETNSNIKPKLGVFAYYLTAIEKLNTYEPIKLRITCDGVTYDESALLCLILNSTHVGGFANFSPLSTIDDGKLDLIVFRNNGKLIHSAKTFFEVLRGQHLDSPEVLFVQGKEFKLESINGEEIYLDIDGDKGCALPATISVVEDAIRMVRPFTDDTEETNEL